LALYTVTQIPGGEQSALRLCTLSVIIAMLALIGSEILARRFNKKLLG
jgi:molybdate transport system permease protein